MHHLGISIPLFHSDNNEKISGLLNIMFSQTSPYLNQDVVKIDNLDSSHIFESFSYFLCGYITVFFILILGMNLESLSSHLLKSFSFIKQLRKVLYHLV